MAPDWRINSSWKPIFSSCISGAVTRISWHQVLLYCKLANITRNSLLLLQFHPCINDDSQWFVHANQCVSSWFIDIWKGEILSFKTAPCLWKSIKNWGHRSHLKIHFILLKMQTNIMTSFCKMNHQESPQNWFQSGLQITRNCPKNYFRVVCESPRITPK